MNQILLLLGPTAVGKTAVACALVDLLPDKVQLISVDSAMVYRDMDIGTAKPTASEQLQYPHALIDVCDAAEPYSAADFVTAADAAINQAWAEDKLPVLVGGTMLYAKRFVQGIATLPTADAEVRAQLQQRYALEGGAILHAELAAVDAQAASGIHPNNPQRLLRALEVVQLTGRPMSEQWQDQQDWQQRLGGSLHTVAVVPDQRVVLYERIEERFDDMLTQGFVEEVERLRARGDLHLDLPSMRAVGYRQAWQYLAGELDQQQFRQQAIVATRRLAKRQLTWLRQWPQLQQMTWAEAEVMARTLIGQLF